MACSDRTAGRTRRVSGETRAYCLPRLTAGRPQAIARCPAEAAGPGWAAGAGHSGTAAGALRATETARRLRPCEGTARHRSGLPAEAARASYAARASGRAASVAACHDPGSAVASRTASRRGTALGQAVTVGTTAMAAIACGTVGAVGDAGRSALTAGNGPAEPATTRSGVDTAAKAWTGDVAAGWCWVTALRRHTELTAAWAAGTCRAATG